MKRRILTTFAVAAITLPLHAGLILPAIIGDHMVLPRGMPVPVRGTVDPGADVTVEFAGQRKATTADIAGRWRVALDPLATEVAPREFAVSAINRNSESEKRKFTDVPVGQVWMCSGQSNLRFPLDRAGHGDVEAASFRLPSIRLPNISSEEPKTDLRGKQNVSRAREYRKLFPFLIEQWRKEWGQGVFPFYWVQLADHRPEKPAPGESDWAESREARTMTLRVPNTGQAVIIDLGDGLPVRPFRTDDCASATAPRSSAP